jgi:hypothetical protein
MSEEQSDEQSVEQKKPNDEAGGARVISLVDWMARKSAGQFSALAKVVRNLEHQLSYLPETDPVWITLSVEMAIISYYLVKQVKTLAQNICSQAEQQELEDLLIATEQNVRNFGERYPEALALVTNDILNDPDKQQLFLNLMPKEDSESELTNNENEI